MSGWIFTVASLMIYIVGAAITWRMMFDRVSGPVYKIMSKCTDCNYEVRSRNYDRGCYRHESRLTDQKFGITMGVIFWPFVALALAVQQMWVHTGRLVRRIVYPRGITNQGYQLWQQAVSKTKFNRVNDDLKLELRKLGIDPKDWLPSSGELDSSGTKTYESLSLDARVELMRAALENARSVNSWPSSIESKRRAVEETLSTSPAFEYAYEVHTWAGEVVSIDSSKEKVGKG